jgi:hypothetical protein
MHAAFLITSSLITDTTLDGAGVDVAGDADVVAHDILELLVNTRFAYAGRDKKKQTDLILSVGRALGAASQTHREGTYAAEVRAGHANNSHRAPTCARAASSVDLTSDRVAAAKPAAFLVYQAGILSRVRGAPFKSP